MYEEQLRDPIIRFLTERGYRVYDQVPLFNGKIDFVGINNEDQCIVVEAKISKWKDAFKQALNYGYGADFVFVALPYKTAKYVVKNHSSIFTDYNVGIIGVEKTGAEILLPSNKHELSLIIKNKILNNTINRTKESVMRVQNFKARHNID